MAIYATVDKADLKAAMESWKAGSAAKAFEDAFDTYVESVTWTDAYCASAEAAAFDYENATWTNAMEAAVDADTAFAFGIGG